MKCPICGTELKQETYYNEVFNDTSYYNYCPECNWNDYPEYLYETPSENKRDWGDDYGCYEDDSDRGCKDCPPDECTGHCMSCYYRPV